MIQELIGRLEKATDDVFDHAAILTDALALLPQGEPFSEELATRARIAALIEAEAFTDAALALMEKVLPGWSIGHIGEDYTAPPKRRIGWTVEIENMRGTTVQVMSPVSLAVAIVLAILNARALQEQAS